MKVIYDLKNIDFNRIKELLEEKEIVVYPTDTVYGVGGLITSEEAIKKIYQAKERSYNSPIIALVSSVDKVEEIAYINEKNRDLIERLIERFWPGGLTIILKKREFVPDILTAKGDTIGIRMPNLDIALKIIESVGGVLPTTSANISGETTPRSYDEVSERFRERVGILIDGGKSPLGEESTIIDMSNEPKIVRVGAIPVEEIEKVIGKI
ncbi:MULTISPECIES: L-threonylcarbamoyladenylate synthase [unclassified Fusobacterium]|uniref:L-threonylcarbamoyladenylate synthase n=1 Tax=unclassified Fusobacterium TaxID=2648384 RepID=UPI0025BF0802|nr:L-threonylcarbamoyladenylate synthase [Fusobacterium sp.]